MKNYHIPDLLTNIIENTENKIFLLANTEFRNQTTLFGFKIYSSLNGTINLKVLIFKKIIEIFNKIIKY